MPLRYAKGRGVAAPLKLTRACPLVIGSSSLFIPKQIRRKRPDQRKARAGAVPSHLRKRSAWVALSRTEPECVGSHLCSAPRPESDPGGGAGTHRATSAAADCLNFGSTMPTL